MANTLYFPDGTHKVLFNSGPTEEFARILDERLGRDAGNVFAQILEDDDWRLDCVSDGLTSYEQSLEDAHNALADVLIECDFLDFALIQTRVDRKECQKAVDKIRKVIGEVV